MKYVLILIILILFVSLHSVTVELNDNNKIDCQLVGKQSGNIYILLDDLIYKIDQENIKSILVNGADYRNIELNKNDWMQKTFDINSVSEYKPLPTTIRYKQDSFKPVNKYDSMTEREFQVYLNHLTSDKQTENTKQIQKTIFRSSVICVVIGSIAYGVINYNSKIYR